MGAMCCAPVLRSWPTPPMAKARKPNRTGRRDGESRHVRLYSWFTECPAWRSLTPIARAVYCELGGLYNGSNNGELFLSVREAARRTNAGKNSVASALKQLVELGFIRPRQGGAFHWKARHATCWILTEHAFAGQLATKDFMRWGSSEIQLPVPVTGRSVPPERQTFSAGPQNPPICPATETDCLEKAKNLSHHRDTDSLPRGGGL